MKLLLALALSACAPATARFELTVSNTSAPGALRPSDSSSHDIKLAPGLIVVHDADFSLFAVGAAASAAIESLGEDGDPAPLKLALEADPLVSWVGVVASADEGTYDDIPMFPGDVEVRPFDAEEGDQLSYAQMFGESNDVFLAINPGIDLFVDGGARGGDLTGELALYDAGTEVNEEPGLGPNQAPRQAEPGAGEAEGGTISEVTGADSGGFTFPAIGSYVSLSLAEVPEL